MECVRLFNAELQSLYDTPPPISKAKMGSITRSAMKSIKFYKHVVQSVEKFIQKCKTEYKIPGLYVIDSIVRQSRHQFGPEKDVFAPRFARNMETTFAHLFKCPPEEKSKIIRVLNLWQKNNVFPPETVQPIFDLANPDHPLHQIQALDTANISMESNHQHGVQSDEHLSGQERKPLDQNTIRQLQQFQQMLIRQTSGETTSVKFNKNLLDFDYGEEDEDHANHNASPHVSNSMPDPKSLTQILSDPNIVKHLQNIQILKQNEMENQKNTKLTEMRLQEEKFEKHLATVLKKLPFANECDLSKQSTTDYALQSQSSIPYGMGTSAYNTMQYVQMQAEALNIPDPDPEVQFVSSNDKDEVINLDANESRSSSPRQDRYRRRKSHSRERSKRDRRRRTTSRSRSRSPRRSRRSREREREHEKERKRKGLPEIKKEHLSVCSTTLWVGHLSKLVQQEELSDTFGKYGDIVSIDMIPPRGCAFIVMHRRQDANKSMQSLKGYKMHNRVITISWAAGKGVKSKEWKDYWDIDLGVSYIPWNKLNKNTNFTELEEGGMFDEETMPTWLKEKLKEKPIKVEEEAVVQTNSLIFGAPPTIDTSQPPPTAALLPGLPVVPPFPMGAVPSVNIILIQLITPMGIPMAPVPMLNVPPPHLMMPTPGGSALMQLNPFSAPPPSFNSQIFGSTAAVSNTVTDDHMDIEGDDEGTAVNNGTKTQDNGNNNTLSQNVFNQPPPSISSLRKDDRQSRDRRNSDNSDRNDRRQGQRWNSADREDSYEKDNRRSRNMRHSGGAPMRNDRDKHMHDRFRENTGIENRGNNSSSGRFNYDNNFGPRDTRGGRYHDNHQIGMQRNDYNRMDEGYDRRNFVTNRYNNMMPIRGGRMGGHFGSRMQSNYVQQGNRSGTLNITSRGTDRRRQWNDDDRSRHDRRKNDLERESSPRHEERQFDDANWDEEVESRWKENENIEKLENKSENTELVESNTHKESTENINSANNVQIDEENVQIDEIELNAENKATLDFVEKKDINQLEMEDTNNVQDGKNSEPNQIINEVTAEVQEGGTTPLCDE
uniref:CSON015316 protein n=1 Tax=Culicoides sonorensis TaxID=179676 RepID=A0A336K4H0_CULSO